MTSSQVRTGTSGFQYPEWKGKFYPADLSLAKMLTYYSSQFGSTEINYTFRSTPSTKTIQRWHDETPDAFRFALKAPQKVTHFAKLKDCSDVMESFFESVQGLGPKTGPVLLQLPPTFKTDPARLQSFLKSLNPPKKSSKAQDASSPRRLAFEFRHESWFTDDVYGILSEHGAALCLAESEDLETPCVTTADFGYLRLRREDYKPANLKRWAKFVHDKRDASTWSEAFIYFKHEETGVGPEFAKSFMKLLGSPLS
ncbi:DUF72 domain-containing protein [Verrucomicrobium sp. BvORR106]|uniref:DUF72 domain-containing protein n=1 Tax=Verrucomicrobium sp. BvORR106 TaxID=1403819 RepID=UPI00056FDA9B|nr:DUF72 domain-containing protein [Verrucomicrobium sp. BvORR106]